MRLLWRMASSSARGLEDDHRHFPAPAGRPRAASRTCRTSRDDVASAAPAGVDPVEVALGRVAGDQGLGLGVMGLEPLPDDLGRVVVPLDEGRAADVADAGLSSGGLLTRW